MHPDLNSCELGHFSLGTGTLRWSDPLQVIDHFMDRHFWYIEWFKKRFKPKSMDRKRLYTLLLCFWCLGALAQPYELVSASGASFQNSSGYISYSIGEVLTSTLTSSSTILTQGFHQTRLRTGVPVINQSEIGISVFPNPVKRGSSAAQGWAGSCL